jgi:hypothetical protein
MEFVAAARLEIKAFSGTVFQKIYTVHIQLLGDVMDPAAK